MRPALLSVVILVVLGYTVRGDQRQQSFLSAAVTEFGQGLHQEIARNKDNIILSPFSIHSLLAMAYLGARGQTADEMAKTLSLENLPGSTPHDAYLEAFDRLKSIQEVKVNVVNGLFVSENKSIEQDYEKDAEKKYYAEVNKFNRTGSDMPEKGINDWMADKTDDLVKEILPRGSIDETTTMVLVNTIIINGTWQDRLDKSKTKKDQFTRPDGSKFDVDMMSCNRTIPLKRDEANRLDVVVLPLSGGQLEFFIILPREVQGLSRVEDLIADSNKLTTLLKDLKPTSCNLNLPKFKVESNLDLVDPLKKMAMVTAFSDKADFSGISKDGVYINKVVHQTKIEVDEDGTQDGTS